MEKDFKVGDRVVRNYNNGGPFSIGEIIKITPKRKDVVVDYGNYKEIYSLNGWQKNSDIWCNSHIELLTPEIEEEIKEQRTISKCKRIFEKANLTAEQATKILEILEEKE